MSPAPDDAIEEENSANPRLALLLASAMFVLVVDTSLMNVSISAVIKDLHTTASGVQSGNCSGSTRLCCLHLDQLQDG